MDEVRNLNNKRVFDISKDKKTLVLQQKNCQTIVTVSNYGTLQWEHRETNHIK